ncbi:MAG: hypothetical protein HZA46_13500 [Planctomycetales bacterium]|nr:hypothetical protein [Planctomycetales bacterium]
MSSGEKTSVDQSALVSRIQSVKQDVLTINQLLASSRRVRLWMMLVLVVWLGAVAWTFLGLTNRVRSDEYLKELGNAAEKHVGTQTEQLKSEADKFWTHSQPVLMEAFKKQWEVDSPKFSGVIEQQRDEFKANMENRIQSELDKRYAALVQKHRKLLETEFPIIKDEAVHERMAENLTLAMHTLVEKYYIEEFKRQLERLGQTWEEFPMADPAEKGEPDLADQLFVELLDLVPLVITATQEQVAE